VILTIKNSTINNSVNFQSFLTKFCAVVVKLFRIISCKFCEDWFRLNYFITKCTRLQFFLGHTVHIYFILVAAGKISFLLPLFLYDMTTFVIIVTL